MWNGRQKIKTALLWWCSAIFVSYPNFLSMPYEVRGLCLMKYFSEMLPNLLYSFGMQKPMKYFSFHVHMLYFIFSGGVFLISGNESSSICRLRFSSRIVSKILTLWWSESWLVDASCVSKSHFASDFSINMLTHSGLKIEKNSMKTIFCVKYNIVYFEPFGSAPF